MYSGTPRTFQQGSNAAMYPPVPMQQFGSGPTQETDVAAFRRNTANQVAPGDDGLPMCGAAQYGNKAWSVGTFGCFTNFNCMKCLMSFVLPCWGAGDVYQDMGGESCVGGCCAGPYLLRDMIRKEKKLEGGCLNDFFTSLFCGSCVISQLLTESETLSVAAPRDDNDWQYSLCDLCACEESEGKCKDECGCCKDKGFSDGCYSFMCPCLALGKAYKNMGYGNGCPAIVSGPGGAAAIRGEMRRRQSIEGSSFNDLCASFWCIQCATAQILHESRHLEAPKQQPLL